MDKLPDLLLEILKSFATSTQMKLASKIWNNLYYFQKLEPVRSPLQKTILGAGNVTFFEEGGRQFARLYTTLDENRPSGVSFNNHLRINQHWVAVKNRRDETMFKHFCAACASRVPYLYEIIAEIVNGGCRIVSVRAHCV